MRYVAIAAVPVLLGGLPLAAGAGPEPDEPLVPLDAEEPAELVKVYVADQDDVLELIAAGADVTEYTKPAGTQIEVHVVATATQQDDLRSRGFAVGEPVVTADESAQVMAEREAALQQLEDVSALAVDTSEPVTIHYTLDGSRPDYESPMVGSAGLRESEAAIELEPGTTTVHWFSVDTAGNTEARYDPNGNGKNYRKKTVRVD